MTPALLRLTLWLNLLFTLVLLVIHAQPYDDFQLRAFLMPPDNCTAPCFMGIQPGLTDLMEGANLLQINRGIESLQSQSPQFYDVLFREGFVPFRQAKIYLSVASDLTIERINLYDSDIALNQVFLAFGRPAIIELFNTSRQNVVAYSAFYPAYGLFVVIDLPLCAVEQRTLWDSRQDVTLAIGRLHDSDYQPDYYLNVTELKADSWAKELRNIKRERCT